MNAYRENLQHKISWTVLLKWIRRCWRGPGTFPLHPHTQWSTVWCCPGIVPLAVVVWQSGCWVSQLVQISWLPPRTWQKTTTSDSPYVDLCRIKPFYTRLGGKSYLFRNFQIMKSFSSKIDFLNTFFPEQYVYRKMKVLGTFAALMKITIHHQILHHPSCIETYKYYVNYRELERSILCNHINGSIQTSESWWTDPDGPV